MRVKLNKDSVQFKMMGDYWSLMQELWGIEDTKEYRDNACRKADEFLAKYPGVFAEGLVDALFEELDCRHKS